jgi:hypothetical protein
VLANEDGRGLTPETPFLYSPYCLEKLSEKGRKGLQRSPTEHPRAHFFLRIPAKSTLGALLVPLFGLFLEAEFSEVRTAPVQHL